MLLSRLWGSAHDKVATQNSSLRIHRRRVCARGGRHSDSGGARKVRTLSAPPISRIRRAFCATGSYLNSGVHLPPYRPRRLPDWIKVKKRAAPAAAYAMLSPGKRKTVDEKNLALMPLPRHMNDVAASPHWSMVAPDRKRVQPPEQLHPVSDRSQRGLLGRANSATYRAFAVRCGRLRGGDRI